VLALENEAESELSYTQALIPGLLQTAAYAQEIIGFPDAPPGEIARKVDVRLTQQSVLTKQDPLELIAVLDEACLRRQVGGAAVMGEQLSHLVDIAQRPGVTLQVLPLTAGFHQGITTTFKIFHFPEEGAADVVYLETMTRDLFFEDEGEVYRYLRTFAGLRELALSQAESIAFLSQIAEQYEREK